ncbi:GIY-YIG nuclease family protein [Salegentibacter sp. BLCTC]|uniref:NUMOD1 domain-containing DNA-binding protein n=1 Tax=Salegentibacter sp. BLCTC TaxID=2697368 RepID=UPI00187B4F73|nr:NUMOD1 domain-containing DNA-binding protein [Salegentibacter sp. BLCTC]MBE7641395.1 GIY-YIG nuclease family protein [Salegentibacter sp. BLCTC]
MNREGIVYRVINKLTNETYIGITFKNLISRKRDHLQKAKKKSGGFFQNAINTYGEDAFKWEQIDTATCCNELAEKEKKYILEYNALNKGYNSDSGGGIKKNVYQYDIETRELLQDFVCLKDAGNAVSATKQDISRACLSANGVLRGYLWSYQKNSEFIPLGDRRKKKVVQLDLSLNFVSEFISVSQAAKKTGLSKTSISRVCRGERESSGGYIWRYI